MNHNHTPVFIVGPVRSGSTFLRLMLDSHPDITNPGECDFLFDMVSDNGQYPSPKEYHDWLLLNRIFHAKQLEVDKQLDYPDLMNSFIEQFSRKGNILTMNVHRHFQKIPMVFPHARFIHLLRDPRDVARSCIGMGWAGHVYYGVDIWSEAENSWERLKKTLKEDQYLEIKYEDLLENIENGLTKICEFLKLDYSAHMLDYVNHSTYKLPNKNLSYQWKSKYSKRELQLVEGKVSEMLLERDYELSGYQPIKPGNLERFWLILRNKGYRIRFNINEYGLSLYLQNFLARKMGLTVWRNACQRKINSINVKGLK